MIQLLPGLRIKVSNKHSTYGRVKVKSIQLFLGKYKKTPRCYSATVLQLKNGVRKCQKRTLYLYIYIYKYIEVFLWYVGGKIEL
jgi:hypothetical protein